MALSVLIVEDRSEFRERFAGMVNAAPDMHLAGTADDQAGFAAMMKTLPDFKTARWEDVPLPDFIPLPAISEDPEYPAMARVWFRIHIEPSDG